MKTCYELGNDPIMCFKHNTKMKVDQIVLNINGSTFNLLKIQNWENETSNFSFSTNVESKFNQS